MSGTSRIPSKELRALVASAIEQGCTLDRTRRHWRLRLPDGGVYVFGGTPSDRRSLLNMRADLRRHGVEV